MPKKTMKDYVGNIKPLAPKNTTVEIRKLPHKNKPKSPNLEFSKINPGTGQLHPMKRKIHRNFFIERTIDLHGLKKEEAFEKLLHFFEQCQLENIKQVMVITGGNSMKKSIIRSFFQKWVEESFGNYIVSCSQAKIQHGGQGAFYLILKNA